MGIGNGMGDPNMKRLLVRTALPSSAAMTVTAVCTLAESFFAAAWHPWAAEAVALLAPVLTLLQAVGYTVALGGSTLAARYAGRGCTTRVGQTQALTLRLAPLFGAAAGLLAFWQAPALTTLCGTAPAYAGQAVAAVRLMGLAAPVIGLQYALQGLLRASGHSPAAAIGVLAGGGVQLICDPLFLRRFGLPGLGAALLVGQTVGALVLLAAYKKCGGRLFGGNFFQTGQILRYGIPCFLRQSLGVVCLALLNRSLRPYGEEAVSAMAAVWRITGLLYAALIGWGQGYLPIAGYADGAGQGYRGKKVFRRFLWVGTASVTLAAVITALAGAPLLQWLTGHPADVFGLTALWMQMAVTPLIPLGVLVGLRYQATGYPVQATLISCCRQGLMLLPAVIFLPLIWGKSGMIGVQPLADVLTFLAALACGTGNKKTG